MAARQAGKRHLITSRVEHHAVIDTCRWLATHAGFDLTELEVNEFGEGISTFHAFQYKDYRWLWLGNTFSSAAMWIQQTTIGWLAYDITGSGALLGTLQSVRNLPPLVTAPLAGVFADPRNDLSVDFA